MRDFYTFPKKHLNLFLPPLLIPLWTSRKVASPEGALFYGCLSSSSGTSTGAGTSSYDSMVREVDEREADVGETTLEEMEMEMQSCHGSHHHRPKHSDDHQGMEELDFGWETYEYIKD